MATRIILQARTSSHRLPAKALLPIGRTPLALLCARRLSNTGLELVVATSTDPTDDLLSAILRDAGVNVFRGDLADVRSRFLAITKDLQAHDVIVRATADNPIPDGQFVESMVGLYEASGQPYFATRWPSDGLAYGLSIEVMTVARLRWSAAQSSSAADIEHVTPGLIAASPSESFVSKLQLYPRDISSLRCTVDTFEDFLRAATLFEKVRGVEPHWLDLIPLLETIEEAHASTKSILSR